MRKGIKNLHIGVYPPAGRVRVAAPRSMNDEAVRLAVVRRLAWIKRHRATFATQPRQTRREYVSGETHYFLGRRYRLRRAIGSRANAFRGRGQTIELHAPDGADPDQLGQTLHTWYRRELRQRAEPLLEQWAQRMQIERPRVLIRRMRTRWGSCGELANRITLNLELIKKPPACLEYVIAHELAHFHERGHGPRFVRLLDSVLPQWRAVQADLNSAPLPYWEE